MPDMSQGEQDPRGPSEHALTRADAVLALASVFDDCPELGDAIGRALEEYRLAMRSTQTPVSTQLRAATALDRMQAALMGLMVAEVSES